ncbi:MAG: hypothetical protein CMP89_07870, partial [Gammaproteobacteria bacterium]|nr:hypothetical protein [Gammaproteobacteria bacterium]
MLLVFGCSDKTVRTQQVEVPVEVEVAVETNSLSFSDSERDIGTLAVNVTAPDFLAVDEDLASEVGDNNDLAGAQPISADVIVA